MSTIGTSGSSTVWALLVGIEKYPVGLPASGATLDVDRSLKYLKDVRGVPEQNIVILKDQDATRKAILNAFDNHLINNQAIGTDDAILFHFSGHGSHKPTPKTWPKYWQDVDNRSELIIPYDAVHQNSDKILEVVTDTIKMVLSGVKPVPGIPDYTLGVKLRELAKTRRNTNITVVLDCCHSGHGTRLGELVQETEYTTRFIDPECVGDLEDDTDADIRRSDTISHCSRGAFIDGGDTSHVLMAACGRREAAHGKADEGGLFTSAWLAALQDPTFHPRSYAEHMKHIKRTIAIRLKDQPVSQTPQCEGYNSHCIVFDIRTANPATFAVTMAAPRHCIIDAGEVYGVTEGTNFELRLNGASDRVVGSVVAEGVTPAQCTAQVTEDMFAQMTEHSLSEGCLVHAVITNLAEPMQYAFVGPLDLASTALHERLRSRIKNGISEAAIGFEETGDQSSAKLLLDVGPTGVTLTRRNLHMSFIKTAPPHVKAEDIDTIFPRALGYIARFNFYLAQESPPHPFADQVELRLHKLEPMKSGHGYMKLGKEIPWIQGEAEVEDHPHQLYGLALENRTDVPLWPYVFWFDPSTYEIDMFYHPPGSNGEEAPLKPGGSLQLGRSPECSDALMFMSSSGDDADTGFLKVYFTTSYLRLGGFKQKGVLGRNDKGELNISDVERGDDGKPKSPIPGQWDTLMKRITTLPKKAEC